MTSEPPLLRDCEWEQLEVREQGRANWVGEGEFNANTLHSKLSRTLNCILLLHLNTISAYFLMSAHPEQHQHREKGTHLHALKGSQYDSYFLNPALSISPLCSLSLTSFLKSLLHSLYHPIISGSLFSSLSFSILPSTACCFPPLLSCTLPQASASITCVMDSWERVPIDLSSEEEDAELKQGEQQWEALQTLLQQFPSSCILIHPLMHTQANKKPTLS